VKTTKASRSPREGDFVLKDYVFASGERRLHYTVLGTPHRDAPVGMTGLRAKLPGQSNQRESPCEI
jgi:hypothetical protein